MKEFGFSVIIPTNNSELGIEKSIESIINQSYDFDSHIEVIIIDNNSEDNTGKICNNYAKRYPDNIKYFKLNEADFTKSLNCGIEKSSGKYVTFLQTHDYYSKDSFKRVLDFINKNENVDLISLPIVHFRNGQKIDYLHSKIKKTEAINLLNKPSYSQLLGLSTFIKKEAIGDARFSDCYNNEITFFSEILINNPNLGIVEGGTYFSFNIDEKLYPPDDLKFTSQDYEKFIEFNLDNLTEKCLNEFSSVCKFIQYNLINHLRWLLNIEKTPTKLDLSKLVKIIRYIDDEIILNNKLLEHEQKIFTFLLKYDNELSESQKEKLNLNTIFIDIYDIINNDLHILASKFSVSPENNVHIYVNGKKANKKELRFPQNDEWALNNHIQNYSFESVIPLNTYEKFKLEFRQDDKKLHIDFSRPCNFSKTVGYAKTKHYISTLKEDAITIKNKTALNWIKQEIKSLVHIIKEHEQGFEKAIPFRIAYMVSYPFLRNKRIWFYMDRPEESDDNGLALFKYSVNKDEGISKYFVLSSNNNDYNEIKKIGKILSYKSIKHRFLGMFAENIITSHPDNEIIYPFWGGYPFFAGLLKSNTMFLQHGILKDDISSWLNKSKMNISLFLVSSPPEYESIFEFPYNYDKDTVKLLGMPRYDTLENQKDKRQIIIMPSWRRNLDHKSREYIKENQFFKRLNSLINNEKLIRTAKEHDYEIIFKPHPKVYEYIDLFDDNGFVKIDYDKVKYQTLFNNGSLMITDYSSVAFDFAYLYKPVIYYQYSDDYHFDLEDSYFDYETMGFGEIVKTEEELVNMVIEYIENDCKLKDEYHKRINEFFLYTDKNNCERAYDKIKEIPLKD